MAKTTETSLIASLFIIILILIGSLVYYASVITASHQRYEILREEYIRLIDNSNRQCEHRVGRLQEQVYTLQFTFERNKILVDERIDNLKK